MIYLIKVNLFFCLFFGLYHIFLKDLKQFKLNRAILIAIPLLSFLLPYLSLGSDLIGPAIYHVDLEEIVLSANASNSTHIDLLAIAYLSGAIIFLIWFIYGLCVNLLKINRADSFDHSFSFLQQMYLADGLDHSHADYVRKHELVHIQQFHIIDIILYVLLRIVCWFNPIVHYASGSVKLNHEYLADDEQADDPIYKKILLNEAMNTSVFSFNHPFSMKSNIKKRIDMMTKNKTDRKTLIRYTLLLPALGLCLWFNACSDESTEAKEIEVEEELLVVAEKQPQFPGGNEAMMTFYQENFKYPEAAKEQGIEGKVILSFVVGADGIIRDSKVVKSDNEVLDKPALDFLALMPAWEPGEQNGKSVPVEMKLPIVYKLN
jgi:TonB family protein